jgi:hypothetical protein
VAEVVALPRLSAACRAGCDRVAVEDDLDANEGFAVGWCGPLWFNGSSSAPLDRLGQPDVVQRGAMLAPHLVPQFQSLARVIWASLIEP